MERLRERIEIALTALRSLAEILEQKKSPVIRDAAIQRFEYTFEAVWKAAQLYLKAAEGIETGSPKGVVRAFMSVGILDDYNADVAMQMADDRNLTVHTYNETLAEAIFAKLPAYRDLMRHWVEEIKKRMFL